jgi:hypothetical protein
VERRPCPRVVSCELCTSKFPQYFADEVGLCTLESS